jgi:hypothetical protein
MASDALCESYLVDEKRGSISAIIHAQVELDRIRKLHRVSKKEAFR